MEKDSIIYVLILSHGSYEYKEEIGENNILSKEDEEGNVIPLIQPNIVVFPENVSFFQKITYTPFGLSNILSSYDDSVIHSAVTEDLMPYLTEKITGDVLTDKIKNAVLLESIETQLAKPNIDESLISDLRKLLQNRDKMYQSYEYDKYQVSNIPLLNKRFDSFDEDEVEEGDEFGIFIAYQENGKLKTGLSFLNKPKQSITTQSLVNMLSIKGGYKRIILIDFSCDNCKSIYGTEPNQEHINHMSSQIPHMFVIGKKSKTKRLRKRSNKSRKMKRR